MPRSRIPGPYLIDCSHVHSRECIPHSSLFDSCVWGHLHRLDLITWFRTLFYGLLFMLKERATAEKRREENTGEDCSRCKARLADLAQLYPPSRITSNCPVFPLIDDNEKLGVWFALSWEMRVRTGSLSFSDAPEWLNLVAVAHGIFFVTKLIRTSGE